MEPWQIDSALLAAHNIAKALGAIAGTLGVFTFWFFLMVVFKSMGK